MPKQGGTADTETPTVGRPILRRELLQGVAALGAGLALGCSGRIDSGGDAGADAGTDADTGADTDADTDAGNHAPIWRTIPAQTWVVGVAVNFDLAPYCTDPDGDPLTYALNLPLPAGLTLSGSVITGTPSAETAEQSYVASADDGR